jgi:hypothetical protein
MWQVTVKKSNENHYPSDDTEIVGDDDVRSLPAQAKLAFLVAMVAGSGLKFAQRIKDYIVHRNCHALIAYIMNAIVRH